MWNFASNCMAGNTGLKNGPRKPIQDSVDSSDDDEASSITSRDEEGLECPICWESFNIVENVPYVLWCGHTLCKNCILGLQWAVVRVPNLPVQLPLFISCPWCNLLSLRVVYKGNLKFPRKNFFLLWMLETMNGDRVKSRATISCTDHHHHQSVWPTGVVDVNILATSSTSSSLSRRTSLHVHHQPESTGSSDDIDHNRNNNNHIIAAAQTQRLQVSLRKSLVFFVHLTSKFPLVIIFLLIILYAIPASAAILAMYILVTLLFALPSFLILYFSYPSLDWLVREIIT